MIGKGIDRPRHRLPRGVVAFADIDVRKRGRERDVTPRRRLWTACTWARPLRSRARDSTPSREYRRGRRDPVERVLRRSCCDTARRASPSELPRPVTLQVAILARCRRPCHLPASKAARREQHVDRRARIRPRRPRGRRFSPPRPLTPAFRDTIKTLDLRSRRSFAQPRACRAPNPACGVGFVGHFRQRPSRPRARSGRSRCLERAA